MMGPKPGSLLILVSQGNHEIKLMDTKVSPFFTNEVRWTQVHAGYTQSLPRDSIMVDGLPCPTCCSSLGFSSQQHPAGIEWEESQVQRKLGPLDLLGLLNLHFSLPKSQSAPGQLLSCFLPSSTSPKMLIPVSSKLHSLN